ncbi:BTB/POZ domain protein [Cooperia oncophora]
MEPTKESELSFCVPLDLFRDSSVEYLEILVEVHTFPDTLAFCVPTFYSGLFQGTRINAHKNVLAACSDYFKAMFTNDKAEKHLREMEVVGVEASTLDAVVSFCYSGKITITEDNSLSILAAACYFQLDEIQVRKTVKLIR